MRPIDADALIIDRIETEMASNEMRLYISKDQIDHAPTVETVPAIGGWISVKDRLPENELMVIGYTPVDGYMFIGFHKTEVAFGYDWSSWYIITSMRSTKKITKKVTHWMPLPEPPKEEKEWAY